MNRELKFNVWDKLNQRFCPIHVDAYKITWHGDFWSISCSELYDKTCFPFSRLDSDRFVICQYTGLKDKNGKEIYDNDIIFYHAIQERFEDIQTGIVTWDQEMSSWVMQIKDGPPGSFYFLYKSLPNDYKIIGNIFENPELLK
jgi:uncharacterized phage protein (TIGR01671 family)